MLVINFFDHMNRESKEPSSLSALQTVCLRACAPPDSMTKSFFVFCVSYVGERPLWPIQCLNKGRKKNAKG